MVLDLYGHALVEARREHAARVTDDERWVPGRHELLVFVGSPRDLLLRALAGGALVAAGPLVGVEAVAGVEVFVAAAKPKGGVGNGPHVGVQPLGDAGGLQRRFKQQQGVALGVGEFAVGWGASVCSFCIG